jgi:hypothetical protein
MVYPREEVSVRLVAFAVLPAIAVIACSTQSLNAQQQEVIYKWQLNKPSNHEAVLVYGGESDEDTPIVLSCKLHSGIIGVFVAETSKALKPNRPINATLAAGSVRSSLPGKTVPNEDAGVPSLQSTLQATDPLLDALAGANSLSIDVGASHQEVPLKGMGNKSREFATLCRKP